MGGLSISEMIKNLLKMTNYVLGVIQLALPIQMSPKFVKKFIKIINKRLTMFVKF